MLDNIFKSITKIFKFSNNSLKTAIKFVLGNFLAAIITGISTIFIAKYVDSETLGSFNKYAILTSYLTLSIFLVDAAFQRHFTYYIGKKNIVKAMEIASTAKWWFLFSSILGSIIFIILTVNSLFSNDYYSIVGWLTQLSLYWVLNYVVYLKVLYRTNDDFNKLNKNLIITSISGFLSLPFIYFFDFLGLALRSTIQNIFNILTHITNVPFKVKAKFNVIIFKDLVKTSIPIQLPVYLDSNLMQASILLLILDKLGESALGIYSVAISFQAIVMLFSQSINQILTTKLMLNFGDTDNFKKTSRYSFKLMIPTLIVSFFIVIFFNLLLDPLMQYLPKYIESVPILRLLSVEAIFLVLRLPLNVFFASLMIKTMALLRISKVIIILVGIYLFNDSLLSIVTVVMLGNLINLLMGYILLHINFKNKSSEVITN